MILRVRPTPVLFFIPRWTTRFCVLYQVCDAWGLVLVSLHLLILQFKSSLFGRCVLTTPPFGGTFCWSLGSQSSAFQRFGMPGLGSRLNTYWLTPNGVVVRTHLKSKRLSLTSPRLKPNLRVFRSLNWVWAAKANEYSDVDSLKLCLIMCKYNHESDDWLIKILNVRLLIGLTIHQWAGPKRLLFHFQTLILWIRKFYIFIKPLLKGIFIYQQTCLYSLDISSLITILSAPIAIAL